MNIKIKVNSKNYELEVEPNLLLVELLRDRLLLTGTKNACNSGECGSCTVIMNGKSILSCLTLACDCDGAEILTIEGLAESDNSLHPIQEAFVNKGAIQCGFCTPGMILSTKYLLDTNPNPTEEEIKQGLTGNICRCTGYVKIIEAVKDAAEKLRILNE
ncbi:MAG: (2Fe-2S)-binding protein [Candidatus Omnitrophota bacterium]